GRGGLAFEGGNGPGGFGRRDQEGAVVFTAPLSGGVLTYSDLRKLGPALPRRPFLFEPPPYPRPCPLKCRASARKQMQARLPWLGRSARTDGWPSGLRQRS